MLFRILPETVRSEFETGLVFLDATPFPSDARDSLRRSLLLSGGDSKAQDLLEAASKRMMACRSVKVFAFLVGFLPTFFEVLPEKVWSGFETDFVFLDATPFPLDMGDFLDSIFADRPDRDSEENNVL